MAKRQHERDISHDYTKCNAHVWKADVARRSKPLKSVECGGDQETAFPGQMAQGMVWETSGTTLPPGPPEEHLPPSLRRASQMGSHGRLKPKTECAPGAGDGLPKRPSHNCLLPQDSFPQSMLHMFTDAGTPGTALRPSVPWLHPYVDV